MTRCMISSRGFGRTVNGKSDLSSRVCAMAQPCKRPKFNVVVIGGVSGCGKTSVAQQLAQEMGAIYPTTFLEGDAFHPPHNIAKMRAGTPLADEDRWPWLLQLARTAHALVAQGQQVVVACSALKAAYREVLLDPPRAALEHRLRARAKAGSHFMPASLLDSQLATLERTGGPQGPGFSLVITGGHEPHTHISYPANADIVHSIIAHVLQEG